MASNTICVKVLVLNRSVDSSGTSVSKRAVKSFLSIGYSSYRKDDVYVLHETKNGNKRLGIKYKASKGNLEKIHEFFLKDGKIGLEFRDPSVHILINGSYIVLKKFLHLLKYSITTECPEDLVLPYLNDQPAPIAVQDKTILIVNKKDQIPNFTRNLRYLQISQCSLKKFDIRIVRLQHLKTLNLMNNELEEIPDQIELLPCLQELILENNKIGRKSTFSWLNSETLCTQLEHLNLKRNELKFVPREIIYLKKIKAIYLDHNQIKKLPPRIGNLRDTLGHLSIANNEISSLPGSFITLRLGSFDFSANRFPNKAVLYLNRKEYPSSSVASLVKQAGRKVLHKRLHYDAETLPMTLIRFLEDAGLCSCCLPVFDGTVTFSIPIQQNFLRFVARDQVSSMDAPLPLVEFNLCEICQTRGSSSPEDLLSFLQLARPMGVVNRM